MKRGNFSMLFSDASVCTLYATPIKTCTQTTPQQQKQFLVAVCFSSLKKIKWQLLQYPDFIHFQLHSWDLHTAQVPWPGTQEVLPAVNMLLCIMLMVMVVYCSNIVHSGTGEAMSVDFSWYSWKKVSEEAIGSACVSVLQITWVVPHILQHHLLVLFFEY